jgi:hypothetical protein
MTYTKEQIQAMDAQTFAMTLYCLGRSTGKSDASHAEALQYIEWRSK